MILINISLVNTMLINLWRNKMESIINILLVAAVIWTFIIFNKQYKDSMEIGLIVVLDAMLITTKLILWYIS